MLPLLLGAAGAYGIYRMLSEDDEEEREETEEVHKFGPVNYFANDRTGARDRWFEFEYRYEYGEWHAYILRMPKLKGRDGNLHYTHRYINGEGEHYICYDPMPTDLKQMIAVSKAWADRELEYIRTGTFFENQVW